MFNSLEKNFVLIDAHLLKEDIDLKDEKIKSQLVNYILYCKRELENILKDINRLPDVTNKEITLKQFEDNYEERILYRIDDITDEMYILQNFFGVIKKYPTEVNELNELVDDVETLLMLLPDEIEKNKLVMLTFAK